jgi:hypothetical protein
MVLGQSVEKGRIMDYLRRIVLGTALLVGGPLLFAQTPPPASQPDCPPIAFNLVGGNGIAPGIPTAYLDNRTTQCDSWTFAYEADAGLSGYTVAFQSSVGAETPSSFGAYTGNTVNSSASFGTAALGLATYCGLATCTSGGTTVNTPWIRVLVSGATGTGNIRGVFYGYKTGYTGGTGGGGGGGGGSGCSSPCPVTQSTVPWQDLLVGASAFASGQAAVTGTAAALASHAAKFVCVKALIGNTINVYVGATGVTTSTGMELTPGQPICQYVSNTNLVFVVASTTGASVAYTYTN